MAPCMLFCRGMLYRFVHYTDWYVLRPWAILACTNIPQGVRDFPNPVPGFTRLRASGVAWICHPLSAAVAPGSGIPGGIASGDGVPKFRHVCHLRVCLCECVTLKRDLKVILSKPAFERKERDRDRHDVELSRLFGACDKKGSEKMYLIFKFKKKRKKSKNSGSMRLSTLKECYKNCTWQQKRQKKKQKKKTKKKT